MLTVPDEPTFKQHTVVSSSTGPFTFDFPYFEKDDLEVRVDGAALASSAFTLTNGAGSATAGYDGGSITLATAIASAELIIARNQIAQRTSNLTSGNVTGNNINAAVNKLTMHAQERRRDTERSVKFPFADSTSSYQLPAATDRADKVFAFDASGNPELVLKTAIGGGGGGGGGGTLDINGLTALASPDGAADYVPIYSTSAAGNRKVLLNNLPININGQTTITSIDGTVDFLLVHDATVGGVRKVLVDNLPFNINGLTAETSASPSADYIPYYDSSAGVNKKMLISALPGGGGSQTVDGVADYTALKALSAAAFDAVFVADDTRGGWFMWDGTAQVSNVTNDPEEGIFVPPSSDTTGASGVWVRYREDPSQVHVDWFGAVGDGTTDDQAKIQAAIDWLISTTNKNSGGEVIIGARTYAVADAVTIKIGVTLKGRGVPRGSYSTTALVTPIAKLIGTGTTNPVVHINASDCGLENIEIDADSTRAAASITTGMNVNCGVLISPPDSPSSALWRPKVRNCLVRSQPADGYNISGDCVHVQMEDSSAIECGRHGFTSDAGYLIGRTNKSRPGIVNIMNCRSLNMDGHGIAIGNPSEGSDTPYRHFLLNFETFRCGNSASVRYTDHGSWIRGENIRGQSCAFSGTGGTSGNTPTRKCLRVSGRDLAFINCRYIQSTGTSHVDIETDTGYTSRNVRFDGGHASTTTTNPTNFADLNTGVRNVYVGKISGDYTDEVSATTGQQIVTESGNEGDYRIDYYNVTVDFTNATLVGASGAYDPANVAITGGTINDISEFNVDLAASGSALIDANDVYTSGQLRILQRGSGDASMRFTINGATDWTIGIDNSSGDDFAIRLGTSVSSAAEFIINKSTGEVRAPKLVCATSADFTGATVTGLSSDSHSLGSGGILTISGGAITKTAGFHTVDTEGAAATDDLDTINGGSIGHILYLQQENSSRDVTVKHGTGNIRLDGSADYSFGANQSVLVLVYDGANWIGGKLATI